VLLVAVAAGVLVSHPARAATEDEAQRAEGAKPSPFTPPSAATVTEYDPATSPTSEPPPLQMPEPVPGPSPPVVAQGAPAPLEGQTPPTPRGDGTFEGYLGVGTPLATSNNLRALGGDATLQFGGGLYFGRHHGLFVDLFIDGYGSTGLIRAAPGAAEAREGTLTGVGIAPAYAFRVHPAPWIAFTYFASIGPQFFDARDGTESVQRCNRYGCTTTGRSVATETVATFRHRLRVVAPFLPRQADARFALAASVVHSYIFGGQVGEAPLSGHTLGWLAELLVDFR
jgi:hypothetical protein